jgi:hypothetical protein
MMQPSLRLSFTQEKIERLMSLGWNIDNKFGNYVQIFPSGMSTKDVSDKLFEALKQGYDVNFSTLELQTFWADEKLCPARNGEGQNLAGSVTNSPAMMATAVFSCSFTSKQSNAKQSIKSADELFTIYGQRVIGEIQRLRLNRASKIFVIFDTGIGYIQCMPETGSFGLYCEAQSAETWPALTAVLTPERVLVLRKAGYSDPGRAPNYWKIYSFDKRTDENIARDIISLLHDVYGYNGTSKLEYKTE